ncbi:MinD/ParA family protein [Rhodococcus sp. G-MC3]|uniref:MinD/ParA family ATP-binding protein n=1 Tax=Rhodococcus sp. G-MC3 TaxID=3046209 RepID=UPI0024B95BEB|nr:MinD/ParA family protein [Rhodococcus sp. G-MC3]MDJ0391913.1 MinD/ParA family protein [Rhodococcus sp. G-MC3]
MNGDRQSPPWQTPRSTDRQPPTGYSAPSEPVKAPDEEWTAPWALAPVQRPSDQVAATDRSNSTPNSQGPYSPGSNNPGSNSPHRNNSVPSTPGSHGPGAYDVAPHGSQYQPTSQDLAPDSLLRRPKRASTNGWRRGVHRLTGGVINPGESTAEERFRNQVERIRQPVLGDYRIAFLSLKGGVGKTTTTLGLGSTFASLRGDCVIAVDANPDFGTLGERVPRQTSSTVRDLLADADNIRRYSDIRAHTSQAPSRLEVLAGERDPAASEMFGEQDYRSVIEMLQVYYNLILTDCGTGIMHSAMNGVLQLANALVLVSSPAVDGARSAAATLDWLQLHGYGHLVERTVVVISSVRPGSSAVDMNLLTQHFLERCRAVLVVPFDEHLAEGAVVDLDLLRPQTRRAFVELAAMVADDFPAASGRHSGQNWR